MTNALSEIAENSGGATAFYNVDIKAKDNGIGFDIAFAKAKNGIGLSNIETRGKLIGATINVSSKEGDGTQMHLSYTSKNDIT